MFRPVRDIGTAWCCFKVSDCGNESVIERNRTSFLRVCTWSCAKGLLVVSKWFVGGGEYSRIFFVFTFSFCFICSNELETQWMLFLIVWRGFAESSDRAVYCSSSQYAPSAGITASWDQAAVVRISGTIAESHWVIRHYPAIHGTSFNTSSTN